MFDFERQSASKFYFAPRVERVVEFTPPDIDLENISRILSLAVDPRCTSCESADKRALIKGRACFRLIYLDKSGECKGVEYNADFDLQVDGDFVEGDIVQAKICVIEADANASQALKLTAVLEICASAIVREDVEMLVGCDKCYKTLKDIVLPTFIATKQASLSLSGEQNVGREVQNVLGINTFCTLDDTQAFEGGAKIHGSAVVRVTYCADDEVQQADITIDIDDEIGIDGVEADDKLMANVTLKSAKVVLSGVTDDNIIGVDVEFLVKIDAFRCQNLSVIDDLFLLCNEIKTQRQTRDIECYLGTRYLTKEVEGNAMLGDNRPPAQRVLALPNASCYTTKWYPDEQGRLTVEGVVNTDIIYLDENGTNSVKAEIPFIVVCDKCDTDIQRVCCSVQDISAKIRREREVQISLSLGVEICEFAAQQIEFVSSVEIGDERVQNTVALSLYITSKGESMLDLCKALCAMPQEIEQQNPQLTFPLEDGDRVVFFRTIKQ